MSDDEFESLVRRLEQQARSDPAGYKTRVVLMALLGNGYLGLMLALIGALLTGAIVSIVWLKAAGVKIAFVIGVFLWLVLKALWVKIPPPEGAEITARDSPELFALIESLRRELRAPRFHHVLVTHDFNAAVVQAPRLGIFGWNRNYLLIGLPLAKSLTAGQFKAVLAHEFGHLAGGHGAMSNWIYRQRLRWSRLMVSLEEVESWGIVLFRPFLRWYAPYFNAYSYPLARANEFEADAASARIASSRAAAEALTAVNVVGSYLSERYWPQIHKHADEFPQPGFTPYSQMGPQLASDIDEASMRRWLDRALERKATLDDTHPSLSERLQALNESARIALPGPGAAADRMLGGALERLTQAFDQRWQDAILPSWQERFQEVQNGRKRLAELDAKHATGAELSLQEAYDRAMLNESAGSNPDAAIDQLRALHTRAPDEPAVLYALGARLLARDDEAGRPLLEAAMRRDDSQMLRCCEALRDYCWRNGRKEEAHEWHERLVGRSAVEQAAAKERNEVRISDKFERHGLEAEALARMQAQLRAVRGLRKAYLVRKRVQNFQDRPCYVLGFRIASFLRLHRKKHAAEVLARIQQTVSFPGETLILNVEGENYRFGRKLAWMRGSRIV